MSSSGLVVSASLALSPTLEPPYQEPTSGPVPQPQDVADVIPRRTQDGAGLARGGFTEQTVPTFEQVERIAGRYAGRVLTALGGTIPDELVDDARTVAAVGAAAQVELSFFPEDRLNVATTLFEQYRADLAALIKQVEAASGTDLPGDGSGTGDTFVGMPAFGFDDQPIRVPGTEWPGGWPGYCRPAYS